MIDTERLRLRQWRDDDRQAFAAMNVDPRVMRYFPAPYSASASNEFIDAQIEQIKRTGWGYLAVEQRSTARFAGFIGASVAPDWHPCGGLPEIGWRLAHEFWGQGFATEAAAAALDAFFPVLPDDAVVAFTSACNRPSRRVMEKLGMTEDAIGFEHPRIPQGSPLRAHVVYRLKRADWELAAQASGSSKGSSSVSAFS